MHFLVLRQRFQYEQPQLRLRYTQHLPTEPNPTNTNMTPTTTVTIPYNKGNSEIIARILQPYNILVAHRPITTLQKLLTKDRQRPNAATARPRISVRPAEQRRVRRNGDINNNIAIHHLKANHRIDWTLLHMCYLQH